MAPIPPLTPIAIALAWYRQEAGHYPETLEALIPKYLAIRPVDLFHRQPYVYRRTDQGMLLYSMGPNGRDDRGDSASLQHLRGYAIGDDLDKRSLHELLARELGPTTSNDYRGLIPADADDVSIRFPFPRRELPVKPPF